MLANRRQPGHCVSCGWEKAGGSIDDDDVDDDDDADDGDVDDDVDDVHDVDDDVDADHRISEHNISEGKFRLDTSR